MSEKRRHMLQGLVKTLPQTSLRSLEMALGLTHDQSMAQVRDLVTAEMEFRYVREAVFAPFLPLFRGRDDGLSGVEFEPWILNRLWAALEVSEPELHTEARYALRGLRTDDPTPVVFYRLVAAGAELCRGAPESLARPGAGADDKDEIEEFGHYLDLHRLARQVLGKLYDYVGRIDAERAAALRILFKDACAIDEESGCRFLEIIFAHLEDGSQIIKFVATVSDRPNDRFLAMSEMADFATRILDKIEADIAALKSFMGPRGKVCDDLDTAGDRVAQSLAQLQSFSHYIELAREGPWGKRVAESHKLIAELVEQQLKGAERTLDGVLVMRSERVYGRVKKDVPDFTKPPSEEVITKARRTLTFIRKIRNIAVAGGFAALHSKVSEICEAEMDSYFTELLGLANGEEPFDADQLMTAFECVTDLMEALCGEEKSVVARRRIASSDLCNPSRDVA